jgi:glycine hydroxymethyltransferase
MKLNFSGKLYNPVAYGVDPNTFLVDMDVVRDKALEHKPKVIIAGWSAPGWSSSARRSPARRWASR